MRVYLIGPMSGIKSFNYPAFDAAKEYLEHEGFEVQSPTALDSPETRAAAMASPDGKIDGDINGITYEEFIAKSIARIITWKPDALVALRGWEESNGACKEYMVGQAFRIPTVEYDLYDPIVGFDLNHEFAPYAPEEFVPYEDNPERQRQVTGGVKDNASKSRVDLIPSKPLIGVGHVLAFGARKYKPNNWRLGLRWSDTLASAMRHLLAFADGQDLDPETGLPHIDQALCQVLFQSEYYHTKTGIDDRWSSLSPEERGEAKA